MLKCISFGNSGSGYYMKIIIYSNLPRQCLISSYRFEKWRWNLVFSPHTMTATFSSISKFLAYSEKIVYKSFMRNEVNLCKLDVVLACTSLVNFHSNGDATIADEELQILTYARHSWSLSSEGFFSVPHLLWHEASVYNGHLRGPVTLISITERLAVELSLRVF